MEYNIEHLKNYEELVNGPIQSDEALFLYALVMVIRPKVIVEFGFGQGHSAINFLKALPGDGLMYSFDINEDCRQIADSIQDSRLKFILKGGEFFQPSDIDNKLIDILFIDASHDLELNKLLFKRVKDSLRVNALIIVHDTGTWNKKLIPNDFGPLTSRLRDKRVVAEGALVNIEEFAHRPGERRFVNYLKSVYPEFEEVNFHSLNTIRHGLSILQKYKKFPLGPTSIIVKVKAMIKNILPKSIITFLREIFKGKQL